MPTLLVDGWHDYPLPGVVEDYAVLRASPAPVHLRIGAGGHLGGGGEGGMTDAPLDWFDTWLLDREGLLDPTPVKVHVQGDGGTWRDLPDWPPRSEPTRWYLHAGGHLALVATRSTVGARPLSLRPRRPDAVDGRHRHADRGHRRQSASRSPSDVLVYTSDELGEPLELLGPVEAELHVGSSLDHTDFFVRICDVSPDGRSVNVCDGLQRFDPASIRRNPDGTFTAAVALWPVGHIFATGHRLRVQVSSGAHPVYARNLGTGEPPATATTLRVAEQTVYHEPGRLSWVTLPHFSG